VAVDDRGEIRELERALAAAEDDARAVASGLSGGLGVWRADPASWSVAQCLDHLATANTVYLRAMQPAAERALREGRRRKRPARPGLIGGLFVRMLEPPVTPRSVMKAPRKIRPRPSPALGDAIAQFLDSQEEVSAFLRTYADIDLACVHFNNPFIPGIRFSLATALHVIAAHERRHPWQAWRARRKAEGTTLV
jgi:hypothetical protein